MQFCAVHSIAQLLWLLAIPLLSAVCQLPFMFTTPYCTRLKCTPYSECAWFELVQEAIHKSGDLFDIGNCISVKLTLNIQLLHFSPIQQQSSEYLCPTLRARFEAEFCKCQDFKTQLLENS